MCCGQAPSLGLTPSQEVKDFVHACRKALLTGHREQLLTAMSDVMSYCPDCLCQWAADHRTDRQPLAVRATLSGPAYFFACEEEQDFDVQDEVFSVPLITHVSQAQAAAGFFDGVRTGVPSSRRARRRYNRRLRLASIEPLRGAPKTPAEEVMTGSWTYSQEEVGRWPGGLGGPVDDDSSQNLLDPSPARDTQQSLEFCKVHPEGSEKHEMQPDVRPVGCTRERANCGDSCLQDMICHPMCALMAAISRLEDTGLLQEQTFEWNAAELVMDSLHGECGPAAQWAVEDVLANLQCRPSRQPVRITCLNVTKWRKELASWIANLSPDLALLQETHLDAKDGSLLAAHAGVFGYEVFQCPAVATGKGGNTGGLAILHRRHLDVSQITSHLVEGKAAMFRVKGFDLYVVNVYLKSGEGFQSSTNAGIIASLLSFVRSIRGAFAILGDFNDDFETLSSTHIGEEARAVWVGQGTSTCSGGGQIDFGLISNSLATCAVVQLDWNTPSRPHAALHWQLDVALLHQKMPQLKGFKPAQLDSQPFQLSTVRPEVTILDEQVTDDLTIDFAALSCAVEMSVYGQAQGRGANILLHRAPLPVQGAPNAGWGGKASAFWCRFLGWIKAVRNSGWHVSGFGQQAGNQLKDVWYGDATSLQAFASALANASQQYRVYQRWKQWHDIWCQPVTTDPHLLAEVKARAIDQAKHLPPINFEKAVKLFKKFPAKAPGADGWTAQMLNNLSEEAVRAVIDFMHACEASAEWPAQFAISLIACLPKSTLRERPIALLHVLYRSYVRLRFSLINQWQQEYANQCHWDRSLPGGAVLDVALGRLVRGECTRHHRLHMVTLFLDLETFFDRCRFDEMFRAGLKLGYPPIILHQAYLVYSGARYLQAEGTVAPVIKANTGLLPGCPAAPSIAKLIMHDVAAELSVKPGASNLDVWIDDLSLDTVTAAPKQTASIALRLFRGLRNSLESRGAKVAISKTSFVATSSEACKALKAICQPDDPAIKNLARDLGDGQKFASTWKSIWNHLSKAKDHWKRVTGPIAATQAYLIELGVECSQVHLWRHAKGNLQLDWTNSDVIRSGWEWVHKLLLHQQGLRIAQQEGCGSLDQGIDFTVHRKLLKRKHVQRATLSNLHAVWQGAMVSSAKPGWCRLCQCPLSLQHNLWECPFICKQFDAKEFSDLKSQYPWPSLWLRGLPPLSEVRHPKPAIDQCGLQVTGLWLTQSTLEGSRYVFACDASGGPGGSDQRLLVTTWSIGAYALVNGQPQRVASVTCSESEPMTVPQAEQRALFELMQRVTGDFDATIDCKSVKQILSKANPPQEGAVPWGTVWHERSRIRLHWVSSHKSAAYFEKQGWEQWRRLINEDVDKLCGERASQHFSGAHAKWLKKVDSVVEQGCYSLARRAGFIIRQSKSPDFPWILNRGATDTDCEAKASNNFAIQCTVCQLYVEQCACNWRCKVCRKTVALTNVDADLFGARDFLSVSILPSSTSHQTTSACFWVWIIGHRTFFETFNQHFVPIIDQMNDAIVVGGCSADVELDEYLAVARRGSSLVWLKRLGYRITRKGQGGGGPISVEEIVVFWTLTSQFWQKEAFEMTARVKHKPLHPEFSKKMRVQVWVGDHYEEQLRVGGTQKIDGFFASFRRVVGRRPFFNTVGPSSEEKAPRMEQLMHFHVRLFQLKHWFGGQDMFAVFGSFDSLKETLGL
ncbi:unnamed protein product [Symbiodinium sp. CCMP2592]|nr:unnamed protein product [Symbiodinium sp. CCMP2592]